MKNLVIKKGDLILVDESGNEEFVMSYGSMIGFVETVAVASKHRGRLEDYERYERLVEMLQDTQQFRDWVLS